MQIALFKALTSINISDDQATEVVKAVEEYLSMKIKEADAELVAQQKATNWLIGLIGTIIIILTLVTGLAPAIWKLFHFSRGEGRRPSPFFCSRNPRQPFPSLAQDSKKKQGERCFYGPFQDERCVRRWDF